MARRSRNRDRVERRTRGDAPYDVAVVGAGPGGSSAAAFLARRGIRTLLLDRSAFPRDKVCGDGLTPQAVYWLDQLGCAEPVLSAAKACYKDCDLYIGGRRLLTAGFPDDTPYPDFATLLDRHRFDHILLQNAVACGADFEPERNVRAIERDRDGVRVHADAGGQPACYRARIVIGADGVASVVSRAIGNTLKDGATAVSFRAYYRGVRFEGSPIKVFFDREFFPGYGWLFADDDGFANVGLGYAFDKSFPLLSRLRVVFERFLETQLGSELANATRCGPVSGGAASFYRPRSLVADNVMLIGDAANQADALNGGGIHKAMESAFLASEAAAAALAAGDFSAERLRLYEALWTDHLEVDRRTAELFLKVALNPSLKDFCLFLLTQIGRLTTRDPQFRDFCSGVFSGVVSRSVCLSPRALYHAFPRDPRAWLALLEGPHGLALGSAQLGLAAFASLARAGGAAARNPVRNIGWGMEVATKAVQLAERQIFASSAVGSAWGRAAAGGGTAAVGLATR